MSAATARVATRPAARPARPAPRAAPAPPARPGTRSRKRAAERGLRGGVLWIIAFSLLLTGVVGVNLAVLRQNMQLDSFAEQRMQLREQNLELRSRLSQVTSSSYVEQRALQLGLKQATTDETTYIRLSPGGK